MFANHLPDEGLVPRLYKELNKKKNTLFLKKQTKDFSLKKMCRWLTGTWKMFSVIRETKPQSDTMSCPMRMVITKKRENCKC